MKYIVDYQGKAYIIEYDVEPKEYQMFHIIAASDAGIPPERLALRSVKEKDTGRDISVFDKSFQPVLSPIPGTLTNILVREGTPVIRGQPLAVIEAMKMENDVYAPCDGTIERIMIQEGIPVSRSETLMTINIQKNT